MLGGKYVPQTYSHADGGMKVLAASIPNISAVA
jgi:hypothetical protein